MPPSPPTPSHIFTHILFFYHCLGLSLDLDVLDGREELAKRRSLQQLTNYWTCVRSICSDFRTSALRRERHSAIRGKGHIARTYVGDKLSNLLRSLRAFIPGVLYHYFPDLLSQIKKIFTEFILLIHVSHFRRYSSQLKSYRMNGYSYLLKVHAPA